MTAGGFLLLTAIFVVVVMLSTGSKAAKALATVALVMLGIASTIYTQTAAPWALPVVAVAFVWSIGMLMYLAVRRTA